VALPGSSALLCSRDKTVTLGDPPPRWHAPHSPTRRISRRERGLMMASVEMRTSLSVLSGQLASTVVGSSSSSHPGGYAALRTGLRTHRVYRVWSVAGQCTCGATSLWDNVTRGLCETLRVYGRVVRFGVAAPGRLSGKRGAPEAPADGESRAGRSSDVLQ
jgi:hypothetical protein